MFTHLWAYIQKCYGWITQKMEHTSSAINTSSSENFYEILPKTPEENITTQKTEKNLFFNTAKGFFLAFNEAGKSGFAGLVFAAVFREVFGIKATEENLYLYVSVLLALVGLDTIAGTIRHHQKEEIHHTTPALNILETHCSGILLADFFSSANPQKTHALFTAFFIVGIILNTAQLINPDVPPAKLSFTQRHTAKGALNYAHVIEPPQKTLRRGISIGLTLLASPMITLATLAQWGTFFEPSWKSSPQFFLSAGAVFALIDLINQINNIRATADPTQPLDPEMYRFRRGFNNISIGAYSAAQLYIISLNLTMLLWPGSNNLILPNHLDYKLGGIFRGLFCLLAGVYAARDADTLYDQDVRPLAGNPYLFFRGQPQTPVGKNFNYENADRAIQNKWNDAAHDVGNVGIKDNSPPLAPSVQDIIFKPRF